MIKVFGLFEKYLLEKLPQITFVSLTVVFFINAFYNIALLTDGTFNFANILIDLFWDENRFFATFIVNLPMILAIKLGCTDFNLFIIMQGFWFFFVTLICLFITYINIPKKHRNMFQFVLLSYLISMNFVGTFFSSKSFLCAGLYWIIAVVLIFENFNTISYKKLFLLLICSIFMIKNYEWSAVFALLFIIYYIFKIKNINTYISLYKKTLIYIIFFIFFLPILSFIFTWVTETEFLIYISKNPIQEMLVDSQLPQALIVIVFIIMILFLSLKKNKSKITDSVLFLCFCCLLFIFINYNFLYSISSYRLFNFFLPLTFSLLIFLIYNKKIFVKFKIIKLLNFILLGLFIFNISVIAQKWNKSLNNIYYVLTTNKGILKAEDYPLSLQEGFQLHMWLSIILQKERGVSNIDSIFISFSTLKPSSNSVLKTINNFLSFPNLKKYGITYSDELLKKIEENSKLVSKINKKELII
ncbi:MAG: hypothetical protein PHR82_02225 [Endomicrobiaceae bacterium]|nr:hypothetical protein [Endomicrobiaceae bacterium]